VLANAGLPPQVIQRRLGHARIGITMDLYAHETPGQDAPAAAAFEQFFGDDKLSEGNR
jgi:integrase